MIVLSGRILVLRHPRASQLIVRDTSMCADSCLLSMITRRHSSDIWRPERSSVPNAIGAVSTAVAAEIANPAWFSFQGWLDRMLPQQVLKLMCFVLGAAILTGCSILGPHAQTSSTLKVELSDSPLTVKFINTGVEPIHLLKPLDGSESCLIMPYYKLTVTDEHGKKIRHSAECGLYGFLYENTKWPGDYLVTIPAGASYTHPLELDHDIPLTGVYTVHFRYIYDPNSNQKGGRRYPRNLWRGEASSNPIKTHLEAVKLE